MNIKFAKPAFRKFQLVVVRPDRENEGKVGMIKAVHPGSKVTAYDVKFPGTAAAIFHYEAALREIEFNSAEARQYEEACIAARASE